MKRHIPNYTTFINESNIEISSTLIPTDKGVKSVEELNFKNSDKFDKKNKLNRASDYKFDIEFIDKLASDGLTYEDMINLQKKVPIFKYPTQMTIHGIFMKVS
jgi:DNA-dependent RNA polymerase auxiliary subunit epsilon